VPTYEYRCKACGEQLEVVQAFTDDALTTCPSCGEAQLRKVFGSVGIAFKGSGFYKNDSRGASKAGSSTTADKSSTSSTTDGSSTSSDSGSSSTTPAPAPSTSSTSDAKPSSAAKPAKTA
jgi:putative FmdB family regulatory protein